MGYPRVSPSLGKNGVPLGKIWGTSIPRENTRYPYKKIRGNPREKYGVPHPQYRSSLPPRIPLPKATLPKLPPNLRVPGVIKGTSTRSPIPLCIYCCHVTTTKCWQCVLSVDGLCYMWVVCIKCGRCVLSVGCVY